MILSGALPQIDRRSLMRSALLLAGASLAGLPDAAFAAVTGERFFTEAEFAVLAEVAEIIIPRTDTPGARDAGVPEALDSLMVNWASTRRQDEFRALVGDFEAEGVLSGNPRSAEIVQLVDAERLRAGDPVYRKFKELVLTLYYLSEAGATQELRYELIPGAWEPGVPMDPDTRAWAV